MLSKALGLFHSDYCKGIHMNMVVAPPTPYNPRHMLQMANAALPYADRFPIFVTAQEISWLQDIAEYQKNDSGKSQRNLCCGSRPRLCDCVRLLAWLACSGHMHIKLLGLVMGHCTPQLLLCCSALSYAHQWLGQTTDMYMACSYYT